MEALNKSIRDLFRARKVEMRTHLASKSMTGVINFGDTSLCRTETLI